MRHASFRARACCRQGSCHPGREAGRTALSTNLERYLSRLSVDCDAKSVLTRLQRRPVDAQEGVSQLRLAEAPFDGHEHVAWHGPQLLSARGDHARGRARDRPRLELDCVGNLGDAPVEHRWSRQRANDGAHFLPWTVVTLRLTERHAFHAGRQSGARLLWWRRKPKHEQNTRQHHLYFFAFCLLPFAFIAFFRAHGANQCEGCWSRRKSL